MERMQIDLTPEGESELNGVWMNRTAHLILGIEEAVRGFQEGLKKKGFTDSEVHEVAVSLTLDPERQQSTLTLSLNTHGPTA